MTRYSECYVAKWYKVGFVTCIDGDPTRIDFRTDAVRFIHERLTSYGFVYMYAVILPYTVLEKQLIWRSIN